LTELDAKIVGNSKTPTIPFNAQGQRAIFGKMFIMPGLGQKALLRLIPQNFLEENIQILFGLLKEVNRKNGCFPSIESFISCITFHFKVTCPESKIAELEAVTKDCIKTAHVYDERIVTKTLTDWLQTLCYRETLIKCAGLVHDRNPGSIALAFQEGIKNAQAQSLEKDARFDIGDVESDFGMLTDQVTNNVTTGIDLLDKDLGGGLQKKCSTIVVGSTNSGKSSWVLNVAFHNVMQKKKVLYISHEMHPLEIITKFRQRCLRMTKEELIKTFLTPEGRLAIKFLSKSISERFVYLPFNKAGGMYVEDVLMAIRDQQEQEISKDGKGFDLIVDDYPMKLSSYEMRQSKDFRHGIGYVYEQLHQLGIELDCHMLMPVQANREGVKQNRNRKSEDEMMTSDSTSEAHKVIHDADNVFVLNRSAQDEMSNIMYGLLDKSRSGPKNILYKMNTDFSRMITHDKSLGFEAVNGKVQGFTNDATASIIRKATKLDET
jgi:replicative DNA helicase